MFCEGLWINCHIPELPSKRTLNVLVSKVVLGQENLTETATVSGAGRKIMEETL